MNKHKLIGVAAVVCCAMQMWGAPLTPQQSLDLALAGAPMKVRGASAEYRLSMARSSADGKAGVYVFTRGESGGFILASADDNVPVLLGYGDRAFGTDGLAAPSFLYWIDEAAREVAYAGGHAVKSPVREGVQREPIPPMCTTIWNQDSPYNDMCPVVNGRVSVTGCAATSAAQVLKYHNWPPAGKGTVSYYLRTTGETLSIDLENTTFDWDSMLDTYEYGAGTPEQRAAVALLMKAVGYGLNMNYSPEASGAYSSDTGRLLGENFSYDKSLRFLNRDWYAFDEWNDIVYKSLSEYGPVIYNGQSNAGGHSFVCDGYDKDDYFHINWGWGGVSDGYFLLNALDPFNQGIGGSTSGDGFNFMQDIICDIRPDKTGESVFAPCLAVGGELIMKVKDGKLVIESMVYNNGPGKVDSGWFSILFTPVTMFGFDAAETIYSSMEMGGLDQMYGYSGIELPLDEFEQGRYRVQLAYSYDGETWLPVMTYSGTPDKFGLSVAEKSFVAAINEDVPDVADVALPAVIKADEPLDIKMTVVNNTGVHINTYLRAFLIPATGNLEDVRETLGAANRVRLSVPDGREAEVSITSVMTMQGGLPSGDYRLVIAAEDGARGYLPVMEPQPVHCIVSSDVCDIEDSAETQTCGYYTLDGIKAAEAVAGECVPALPRGVYILRGCGEVRKVMIE